MLPSAGPRGVGTVLTLRGRTMYESRPMHSLTYFACSDKSQSPIFKDIRTPALRQSGMKVKYVTSRPLKQRRRIGGGDGGARPAMLKPRGREYLLAPTIFSQIFACCSLNFHSWYTCERHDNKTTNTQAYPIPIRLAYVVSKMAIFYVGCD